MVAFLPTVITTLTQPPGQRWLDSQCRATLLLINRLFLFIFTEEAQGKPPEYTATVYKPVKCSSHHLSWTFVTTACQWKPVHLLSNIGISVATATIYMKRFSSLRPNGQCSTIPSSSTVPTRALAAGESPQNLTSLCRALLYLICMYFPWYLHQLLDVL